LFTIYQIGLVMQPCTRICTPL